MEEIKLWESFPDKYLILKNIDEVIKAIEDNKLSITFTLKDTFIPGNEINDIYDNYASKRNYIFKYTDDNHPVLISELQSFINPNFYNKYRDVITYSFIENIKSSNKKTIHITKILFSDYLLNELLNLKDISIYLDDINLTDEQLNKIKESFLNVYIQKKDKLVQIGNKYVFSFYTKEFLQDQNKLMITMDKLLENDIKNLKYLKENCLVYFNFNIEEFLLEDEKLSLLKEKLLELDSINKKFIIKIPVEKRSIFNKLFKDIKFSNLNLVINNDLYDYPYEEYLKEEEKLNDLIIDIKDKDLSPFEKYLYIYELVRDYKPYKENVNNLYTSRQLRYILDNEYMVCVGYAVLITTLLDKIGINAIPLSVGVDTSYDKGFTKENIPVQISGHQRIIISMDDDKYNIHGLYIGDPTWDNNLEKLYLNHSLLTFDKMQVDKRMFKFDFESPLLDIHNFNEYNEQVNYLLKRRMFEIKKFYKELPFSKQLILSYKDIGLDILNTIKCDKKYKYFLNILKNCNEEKDYINFYTELGNYLLTRINILIKEETIFKAYQEMLKKIGTKDVNKIDKWVRNDYYEKNIKQFPYEIDNNSKHKLNDKKILIDNNH